MTEDRYTLASESTLAGLVAGLALLAFEMVGSAVTGDTGWTPLRMKGAILLGRGALDPGYPWGPAILGGAAIHFVLSATFGWLFGQLTMPWLPLLARFANGLIWVGGAYGLVLWLVNFYGVGPLMGWAWFTERSDPVTQPFVHMSFGCILGLSLNRRLGLAGLANHRAQQRAEVDRPRRVSALPRLRGKT